MKYATKINKHFGAFVRQAARAGADKAIAVAIYVNDPAMSCKEVREEIAKSLRKGLISEQRKRKLDTLLNDCWTEYQNGGKVVQELDMKDWRSLGNGCFQRINHLGSENRK